MWVVLSWMDLEVDKHNSIFWNNVKFEYDNRDFVLLLSANHFYMKSHDKRERESDDCVHTPVHWSTHANWHTSTGVTQWIWNEIHTLYTKMYIISHPIGGKSMLLVPEIFIGHPTYHKILENIIKKNIRMKFSRCGPTDWSLIAFLRSCSFGSLNCSLQNT